MIKSELVAKLAQANPHLYQRDVERIVSTIFDEIGAALAKGDRVELIAPAGGGYGKASVRDRAAVQADLDAGWITPDGAAVYGWTAQAGD